MKTGIVYLKIVSQACLFGVFILGLSGCEREIPPVSRVEHAAVGLLDASISSDGRFAVVSSVNHGAGYWDLANNQLLYEWRHNDNPEDAITSSDIAPDGLFAITADKHTFVIWDTQTGKSLGYWQAPADIRDVAIANLGRYVLLGLGNGLAVFIDMKTGRRIEFTGHRKEAVASVDLSPNGAWAFSGGNDYRAVLWNTQTGQPRYVFEHETRVTLVSLDDKGRFGFTSGTRGNATVWDLNTGTERVRLALKPREYVISAATFSEDARWLATGAPGRDITLWSTQSGQILNRWKAGTRQPNRPSGAIIWALAFDQDGQHLITESSAGLSETWAIFPLLEH